MRLFLYDPFAVLPKEQCSVSALRAQAADWDVTVQSKLDRSAHHGSRATRSTDLGVIQGVGSSPGAP
jgi:hypothetical protein